jgi:hypothetical protein
LSTLRKCCSKEDKFLKGNLPLLESIFRLILANGNEPIDLDKIAQRLAELRGSSIDNETLRRLLDNDEFYGLRALPAEKTEEKNS